MTQALAQRFLFLARRAGWARGRKLAVGLVAVAVLVAGWQLVSSREPSYLFPSIAAVLRTLLRFAGEGELFGATSATLRSVASGSAIALVGGTAIGFALARFETFTKPLLNFVQTVPYVVWALMAMIWFGLTRFSIVFTIAVASFPTVSLNVAAGLRNIDGQLLMMSRSVRANRFMILRHVLLPSLTPFLMSGARGMLAVAFKMSVLAELFAGGAGIGHSLFVAWEFQRTVELFAWTVWLVMLMLLTDALVVGPIELFANRWKRA
jgi:ABC-type nitrate/sulfonate/bicarbonate transport system permease component